MASKKKPETAQRLTFNREVRVKLTPDEKTERVEAFGRKWEEWNRMREEHAQKKREMTVALKNVEREMHALGQAAKDGDEMRPVECYGEVVRGQYLVKRTDTDEVIEARAATMQEMQVSVPGTEPKHPPGGGLLARAAGAAPPTEHTPEPNSDGDIEAPEQATAKPKKRKAK